MTIRALFVVISFGLAQLAFAADKKEPAGHCEKKQNGKTIDLPKVKDKKACKLAGGLWNTKHAGGHDDGHDHGDGHGHNDGHDHDH